MAKSIIGAKQAKAAAARARMAKRSRRQRWIKENKKRITIGILVFIVIAFLAIFTPWGPEFYYNEVQARKMESKDVVSPGAIRDLYSLATFYHYSFREKNALDIYNEIGIAYFGFKITDYGLSPENAKEKRRQAELNKKKGVSGIPPFKIDDSDLPYVGLAIFRTGEIMQKDRPKQFIYRVYQELYLDEFLEEHPDAADADITDEVQRYVDRFMGRR